MRLLIAAIALFAALPAAAQQPPPLKLGANQPYHHKPSGLTVPTVLDGLQRTLASAYVPDLDEALGFDNPANTETLSVYVFRNITGSVALWFDRIDWVASHRAVYGSLIPDHPPMPFAPSGHGDASGLIDVYAVGKGPYRSTGIAFMPVGPGWYVSLRYSSKTYDPATLEAHLRAIAAALGWPAKLAAQPAAVPIADCTTPLTLSGPAKAIDSGKALGSALLFGALLSSTDETEKRKMAKGSPPAPAVTWCRDIAASVGLGTSGVYRPTGTNDRYLLAYQDAGRGLMVEPDSLSLLLDKKVTPSWSITEFEMAAAKSYLPRDRLPSPDEARTIVAKEQYASKASTWGGQRNVQINTDVLK
jgi:hypothetical protein